jgi:hypothetical protein
MIQFTQIGHSHYPLTALDLPVVVFLSISLLFPFLSEVAGLLTSAPYHHKHIAGMSRHVRSMSQYERCYFVTNPLKSSEPVLSLRAVTPG